ncbi:MAG: signal peptidase II [Nanoarchaeota archaeon]|nr:signal peptidase II [Nanoarchaeota archaeon]
MKLFYKRTIFFVLFVILDQLTKLLVLLSKPMIDLKVLAINYVQNTGASFGILKSFNTPLIWVSLIAIGVVMMNCEHFPKKSGFFTMMLLAGITGNFIDRVFRGFVIDFIDLKFWPIFNFADMYICLSVLILIILFLKEENKGK